MKHPTDSGLQHPQLTRRSAVQAGAIGLMGLGMPRLAELRAQSASPAPPRGCIYIFLSGGLSQIDSFDMKPHAPERIRGDFRPIATRTPGMQICEHMPRLAQRSDLWSICRSVTHPSNNHSEGHMIMLSGRTQLPPAFSDNKPNPSDWPSIAAVANAVAPRRGVLPPAMVLPDRMIHQTGRVIPGQGAGMMGPGRDPWFIEASPFHGDTCGAYPQYAFQHQNPTPGKPMRTGIPFAAPNLSLPPGLDGERLGRRGDLLRAIGQQQTALLQAAETQQFDRFRHLANNLLADPRTQRAFDVHSADARLLDRYGRHSFGWSLLMARQLIEAGVSLVQVNLGNNETWDTHGNATENLKNKLFPPMDQSVSALLEDLSERGLLDSTLVVMASEFGRTPHQSGGPSYATPGRNHWGGAQSVLFAGGGIQGGRAIGSTDRIGAYPTNLPQTPENFAATIYDALGVPQTAAWNDPAGRPHYVYHSEPIAGLRS